MKINGLTSTGANSATSRTGGSKPGSGENRVSAGDEVHLSSASTALAANGGDPVVDAARVQEIRQAITEGRFQINAGAIADRLIATARELVDSQRKA